MTNTTALSRLLQPSQTPNRVLVRLPGALQITGLKRATFCAQRKDGLWPEVVALGPRARAYPVAELEAVCKARCGER